MVESKAESFYIPFNSEGIKTVRVCPYDTGIPNALWCPCYLYAGNNEEIVLVRDRLIIGNLLH